MKVQIGTVKTTLEINEPVGSLSPEDVRRLMQMMEEQTSAVKWKESRHQEDRSIRSRSYLPDLSRENT